MKGSGKRVGLRDPGEVAKVGLGVAGTSLVVPTILGILRNGRWPQAKQALIRAEIVEASRDVVFAYDAMYGARRS